MISYHEIFHDPCLQIYEVQWWGLIVGRVYLDVDAGLTVRYTGRIKTSRKKMPRSYAWLGEAAMGVKEAYEAHHGVIYPPIREEP